MSNTDPNVIADKIAKTEEAVTKTQKSVEEILAEVKSANELTHTKEEIINTCKAELEASKKSHKEELEKIEKSFGEKIAEMEAKNEHFKKSSGGATMAGNSTKPGLTNEDRELFKKSLDSKDIPIPVKVFKSLISYDNAGAGAVLRQPAYLGTIDVNIQTSSPVLDLVNTVVIRDPAVQYFTIDSSIVMAPSETLEGTKITPSANSIARGQLTIRTSQYKAYSYITTEVLNGLRNGTYMEDVLAQELAVIDAKLSKHIGAGILNGNGNGNGNGLYGILPKALEEGSKIRKVPTVTSNLPTLQDISLVVSHLKQEYLRGAVILIDRKVLNMVYNEQAEDGHLKMEYFDYANGLANIRTAEGVFPLIGVDSFPADVPLHEHNGFAGYKSFTDPSETIDEGYIAGGNNTGKAYMILANLKRGYTLVRGTNKMLGVDSSFADKLVKGTNVYGIIDDVGGGVTCQEAIAVGYIS